MTDRSRVDAPGTLLALTAVLCWCSVPLFIKYFTGFFDKYTQNGLRYSVAALIWLPVLVAMIRAGRVGPGLWSAALLPALINTIAQTFWSWALYYIDPGIVGFLSQLNALIATSCAMWLLPDERRLLRCPAFWVGLAASMIGFALTVGGHPKLGLRETVVGIVIMTAGAIPWGLYPVSVRLKVSPYPPVAAFGMIALYTAIGCDALMFALGEPIAQVRAAPWTVHVWLVISAILGIGLAHSLYYGALRRMGVTVTAGILLLIPFATAVLSIALWDDHLSALQWIGGAGLVAGTGCLLYAQRVIRPPSATASPAAPRPAGTR